MNQARQIWNSILHYGHDVKIVAIENKSVNPFALLASLADAETSFGLHAKKRHEKDFDIDGLYFSEEAYKAFKEECTYSWGIWQLMGTTLFELGLGVMPNNLEININLACEYTMKYLNERLQHATCLNDVADGFNSRTHKNSDIPFRYVDMVNRFYVSRLEQVKRYYISGDESTFNN
jgi:hypothetical protein